MTTRPQRWNRRVSNMAAALTTASKMAVPPDGVTRSRRPERDRGRVQGAFTVGAWLNTIRKASSPSSSSERTNRSIAFRAAAIRTPIMLSLTSTARPRLTGTRSALNCRMRCSTPSSKTRKSLWVRPGTRRPSASMHRGGDDDQIHARAIGLAVNARLDEGQQHGDRADEGQEDLWGSHDSSVPPADEAIAGQRSGPS